MSRTLVIIIVGVVLAALFLLAGALVRRIGTKRAAEDFLLVWFALAAGNLAIGVFEEGYSFAEELPILVLIFAVPGVIGFVAWFLAHRRTTAQHPTSQSPTS